MVLVFLFEYLNTHFKDSYGPKGHNHNHHGSASLTPHHRHDLRSLTRVHVSLAHALHVIEMELYPPGGSLFVLVMNPLRLGASLSPNLYVLLPPGLGRTRGV